MFLKQYWQGIMRCSGVTEDECECYLQSLRNIETVRVAAPLVFERLSMELVGLVGLRHMKAHTSTGLDVVPAFGH